jgi:hypothetical protein
MTESGSSGVVPGEPIHFHVTPRAPRLAASARSEGRWHSRFPLEFKRVPRVLGRPLRLQPDPKQNADKLSDSLFNDPLPVNDRVAFGPQTLVSNSKSTAAFRVAASCRRRADTDASSPSAALRTSF